MKHRQSLSPGRIESLEARLQFAGFSANINFSTAAAPNAAKYVKDYGGTYTPHRNGLTYGWNTDLQSAGYYKRSTTYNNALVDSNIAIESGDIWAIKVPNGYYKVHALMGQPGVYTGDQRLNAEGQLIIKGEPDNGYAILEGFATVHVKDGKLTISSATGAVDDKLISLEITSTTAPAVTPTIENTSWSTSSIQVPIKRVEFSSTRVGTKIYMMGGFIDDYSNTTQRFEVYDTKTLTFTQLTDLPGAPTHEAVATDGTYIYAAGGQFGPDKSTDLTNRVWRYDIAHNTWQAFGKLPSLHTGGAMVYLDGKLHYVGGDDYTRVNAQTTHWVLDLSVSGARWTNAAAMPAPSDHLAAVTANGVLYAVGGEISHGVSYLPNTGLFAYDPDRDKWVTFASLPIGISHAEASTFVDGRNIFVVAGQTNAQQLSDTVFVYNMPTNRWYQTTSLPTGRKGGVSWIRDGKLYYLTGDDAVNGLQRGGYVGEIGA